jgi:hypothetical protein
MTSPFFSMAKRAQVEEELFSLLLAEFGATTSVDKQDIQPHVERLRGEPITMAVILEMQLLLLQLKSTNELLQTLPDLRSRWSNLKGRTEAKKALASDREQLLAETEFLTSQLALQYKLQEGFAILKRKTIQGMLVTFCSAVGIVIIAGFFAYIRNDQTIIQTEMLIGLLGGFVSSFLRIYLMLPGSDLIAAIGSLRSDRAGLMAKPLLGAAFAVALHLLFMSKMLSGGLFPSLAIYEIDGVAPFAKFFYGNVIATPVDFAKLLIWCFIGGFAERFVPDILDRFSSSGVKQMV